MYINDMIHELTKEKWEKHNGVAKKGVMLHVIPMSLLCPSKNEVAFKITIELVIDQNWTILITSFLEGHKRDMGMTFRITLL
jgi:hypothetical protein